MAAPLKLTDEKRAEIIADIEAGVMKRNEIARKHNVGDATVSRIATAAGIKNAFDREPTKKATAAALADAKARQAALRHVFLDRCQTALNKMEQPYLVHSFGGKDNIYTEHLLDIPPSADLRNLMIIAATALDKSLAIDKADIDTSTVEAASLLGTLLGQFQTKHGTGE